MSGLLHWIKNAGRPLAAYWAMTAFGLIAFSVVAFIVAPDPVLVGVLLSFVLATVVGQALGNALGFLRPRLWVAFLLVLGSCILELVISPFLLALGPLAGFAYIVWFMLPFTLLSGFFAVRNRMEIFGAWIPMMYGVGAAILIINAKGKVSTWETGSKWAVWDVFTVPILAGCILFFVIYLVMRQSHSLSLWQESVDVDVPVVSTSDRYKPRARISWLTWGCVGLLAMLLTCSTAVVSPYLFRTAPAEDGKGSGGDGDEESKGEGKGDRESKGEGKGDRESKGEGKGDRESKGGGKGDRESKGGAKGDRESKGGAKGDRESKGGGKGSEGGGSGSEGGGSGSEGGGQDEDPMRPPDTDPDKAAEGAKKAAEAGLHLLLWLLLLLAAALLFGGALFRPTRREVLIRHLESPTVRVAPSRRVENLWRRAVIALHDAGIPSSPSEPASTLAERAVIELQARYREVPPGLTEAAAIYTRIHYNLGIGPEDDLEMASNVNRFTRFVGARTDLWTKIRNYYRGIPDWE